MSNVTGITSPIRLLAYFGAVVEAVIGSLSYGLATTNASATLVVVLALTTAILPLAWLACIFVLITKHHAKLYSPMDYPSSGEFLEVLQLEVSGVGKIARNSSSDPYRPFVLTQATSESQLSTVQGRVEVWHDLLLSMRADEFTVMHAWYNEHELHDLGLLCIDIAISRGAATSKLLGFRSATLRRLGRLRESQASASLALILDSRNVDAHYNLARTLLEMGRDDEARGHLHVAANDPEYARRIAQVLPDLETEPGRS
jgi:hypothetical protein